MDVGRVAGSEHPVSVPGSGGREGTRASAGRVGNMSCRAAPSPLREVARDTSWYIRDPEPHMPHMRSVVPMTPLALFLPELGAVPRWLQITAAVVVLGLMATRVWLFFRRRK